MKHLKIQIFSNSSYSFIQDRVNEFLATIPRSSVRSITATESTTYYTVSIIYKY